MEMLNPVNGTWNKQNEVIVVPGRRQKGKNVYLFAPVFCHNKELGKTL